MFKNKTMSEHISHHIITRVNSHNIKTGKTSDGWIISDQFSSVITVHPMPK